MMGCRLPAWLELADGKPKIIPDRAITIRRIFALAADGLGHTRIIRTLEKENVAPFGERVVNEGRGRSQFSGRWTKPYVALLLRDRRVTGDMQPLKRKNADGPTLRAYYPGVISETEFALARSAQEERLNHDKLGRKSGPRQGKYVNVFKSMLIHARDGEGFLLHNKGTGAKPISSSSIASGNGGNAERSYTFPYFPFEEAVLKCLREINPSAVLPPAETGPSRADAIRAKLTNCRQDIASIKKELEAGYSKGLADVLRKMEATEEVAVNELQDELARTARPLARSWEECPTLIDAIRQSPDPERARLKLRAALRAIVETAYVLIVPRGSWRLVAVQFYFTGGSTRSYLIAHQTAGFRRAGGMSPPLSFADAGLPSIDLHKTADVKKVERLLLRLELTAVE